MAEGRTSRLLIAMPMKPFEQAKSRLAAVLPDDQRERLARALFLRTQRFFATHFSAFDRLVVSPSEEVRDMCTRVQAHCLLEPGLDGLNVAAARAIAWANLRGYDRVLLIPGDVPVWVRSEVNTLLHHGLQHQVVIAQARDGGTNALLLRLPTPFACRYGHDSAAAHRQVAREAGLSAIVCKPPFLAHDLDVPADCAVLAARNSRVLLERP
jgi:2-phospho-L-lactate/phosphoenolpyruvate guanylyltransferase